MSFSTLLGTYYNVVQLSFFLSCPSLPQKAVDCLNWFDYLIPPLTTSP